MKKLLALILAAICCLGMFACGGEDNSKTLDDAISLLNSLYKDTTRTPADYEVVSSVKVGDKDVAVTWSVSNDAIKVVKNGKMYTIDVPSANETETTYVLKATVKIGKDIKSKSFTITLPVIILNIFESEPAENTAFKLMLTQGSLGGKNLFATHAIDQGKFFVSTEDASAAPDFFAEKVEGGYKFYTMIDGVKSYVVAYLEGTSKRLKYDAAEGTVWYYKEDCKAWFTMINGGEYVIGTYQTWSTFSLSDGYRMTPETTGVSQFPANLITMENIGKLNPADEVVIYNTPEEIVNALYALEDGKILSAGHIYTLTGVITEVKDPYSEEFKNVTVIITVGTMTDKPITVFRVKGDGAATIKVGDTITVSGTLTNYQGTFEFNSGCTLDAVTPAA